MSDLARVHDAVHNVMAYEIGETDEMPDHIEPPHEYVGGLRVPIRAAKDAAFDLNAKQRYHSIVEFRADAKIITDRLRGLGIEPIAVLPQAAWNRICNRKELFRFAPDDKGRVHISEKIVRCSEEEAREQVRSPNPAWAFLVFLAAMMLNFYLASSRLVGLSLLATVFGPLIAAGMLEARRNTKRREVAQRIIAEKVERARQKGSLYKKLWPNYQEPEWSSTKVSVGFPDPPIEVQRKLATLKQGNIPLHVAAEADAIALHEDPVKVLQGAVRERQDMNMMHALLDPISYVVEGDAVAVVAQFGDFEAEQEAVAEAANAVYLPS